MLGAMAELTEKEVAAYGAALRARRAELAELDDASREARDPVALDQQSVGRLSRMDALQQQAMAQAEERRRHTEMARIDAALQRIEEGEFGWCLVCGEAIPGKRLDVDPSVPTCVNCSK